MIVCLIIGVFGLFALFGTRKAHHRLREVRDVPTTPCARLAPGRHEINGIAVAAPSGLLQSPLTGTACVWWRVFIQKIEGKRLSRTPSLPQTLLDLSSPETIHIRDESGTACIAPEGAENIPLKPHLKATEKSHIPGAGYGAIATAMLPVTLERGTRYIYQEWILLPESPVYALGEVNAQGVLGKGDGTFLLAPGTEAQATRKMRTMVIGGYGCGTLATLFGLGLGAFGILVKLDEWFTLFGGSLAE